MKPVLKCLFFVIFFVFLCTAHAQVQRVDPNAVRAAKPGLPAPKEQIVLGEPNMLGTMTVETAIAQQKNIRTFLPQQLEPSQLRQLAWAGQSITPAIIRQQNVEYTVAPMELYFCLWPGVYRYNAAANTLDSVALLDVRGMLAGAARSEASLKEAPCVILITGTAATSSGIPREQMRNIMMLIAGKTAQNISLEAQSLGLGTLGVISFDMGKVKRIARLPAQQEPLYILTVGYPVSERIAERRTATRVLFIMPGSSRPDELFQTMDLLNASGIRTILAQSGPTLVRTETTQRRLEPDLTIQDVNVADYDAIIPVSGAGNPGFMRSPILLRIIRDAVNQGKIVGAAGETTGALANAGVLAGVRITGDPIQVNNNRTGAIYTGNLIEVDKGIVTALNPRQSTLFARAIMAALRGEAGEILPNTQAVPGPGEMLDQRVR